MTSSEPSGRATVACLTRARRRVGPAVHLEPARVEAHAAGDCVSTGRRTADQQHAGPERRRGVRGAGFGQRSARRARSPAGETISTLRSAVPSTPRPPATRTRPSVSKVAVWSARATRSEPNGRNAAGSGVEDLHRRRRRRALAGVAAGHEHPAVGEQGGRVTDPRLAQARPRRDHGAAGVEDRRRAAAATPSQPGSEQPPVNSTLPSASVVARCTAPRQAEGRSGHRLTVGAVAWRLAGSGCASRPGPCRRPGSTTSAAVTTAASATRLPRRCPVMVVSLVSRAGGVDHAAVTSR